MIDEKTGSIFYRCNNIVDSFCGTAGHPQLRPMNIPAFALASST